MSLGEDLERGPCQEGSILPTEPWPKQNKIKSWFGPSGSVLEIRTETPQCMVQLSGNSMDRSVLISGTEIPVSFVEPWILFY